MNVRCEIMEKDTQVAVWRGTDWIATAFELSDGTPVLMMMPAAAARCEVLTFNDLDIIRDNWNQMVEMKGNKQI